MTSVMRRYAGLAWLSLTARATWPSRAQSTVGWRGATSDAIVVPHEPAPRTATRMSRSSHPWTHRARAPRPTVGAGRVCDLADLDDGRLLGDVVIALPTAVPQR